MDYGQLPPNPAYFSPNDPTYQLMKGSCELGMPMNLFGQILASFPTDRPIPVAVMRYTFGPLVYGIARPGEGLGWLSREVIERWRPRVDVERLEIAAGERPDLVSPAEIMLVMYNYTHEAPLATPLARLYIWACHRAFSAAPDVVLPDKVERYTQAIDDRYLLAKDDEVFAGPLLHEYRDLCRSIITKVVANSKIRARPFSKKELAELDKDIAEIDEGLEQAAE